MKLVVSSSLIRDIGLILLKLKDVSILSWYARRALSEERPNKPWERTSEVFVWVRGGVKKSVPFLNPVFPPSNTVALAMTLRCRLKYAIDINETQKYMRTVNSLWHNCHGMVNERQPFPQWALQSFSNSCSNPSQILSKFRCELFDSRHLRVSSDAFFTQSS